MQRVFRVLDKVSWKSPGLAGLETMASEFETRFGPPVLRDLDSNGLGPVDIHLIAFDCGLEVALWRYRIKPKVARLADPSVEPLFHEIYANQLDVEHIAFHLEIDPGQLSLTIDRDGRPLASTPQRRYRVLRVDDHGNQFLVRAVSSMCEANALARAYEARGHKQTYWVDAAGSG